MKRHLLVALSLICVSGIVFLKTGCDDHGDGDGDGDADTDADSDGDGDADIDSDADSDTAWDADSERHAESGDCAANVLQMVLTIDDGVADSQVVPIVVDGEEGWLGLDTGSPATFLFSDPDGPEFVPYAGTIDIGCEAWDVPGFHDDALGVELFEGKPILGVLGIDFFLTAPSEIDYPGARLVRYDPNNVPSEIETLPSIPLSGAEHERPVVDVTIDDVPLRMLFDAGSHDTIWLGVEGGPDDEVTYVQTADGETWELFVGDGTIALPGEPTRTIPVLRALELGYLTDTLEEIDASGLLGLTGMGFRRVFFDFEGGVMRIGPLETP